MRENNKNNVIQRSGDKVKDKRREREERRQQKKRVK